MAKARKVVSIKKAARAVKVIRLRKVNKERANSAAKGNKR